MKIFYILLSSLCVTHPNVHTWRCWVIPLCLCPCVRQGCVPVSLIFSPTLFFVNSEIFHIWRGEGKHISSRSNKLSATTSRASGLDTRNYSELGRSRKIRNIGCLSSRRRAVNTELFFSQEIEQITCRDWAKMALNPVLSPSLGAVLASHKGAFLREPLHVTLGSAMGKRWAQQGRAESVIIRLSTLF